MSDERQPGSALELDVEGAVDAVVAELDGPSTAERAEADGPSIAERVELDGPSVAVRVEPAALALSGDDPRALEPGVAPMKQPWAERLVRFLDDGIKIPGTQQGIGVDPILGFFFPGAGDAITGVGSASLLMLALKERVPAVVLLRMVLNIGVDVLFGALPVLGDVFDIFWRSNRRNLDLIHAHRRPGAKASPADYAVVGLGLVLAALSIAMPFIAMYLVGASMLALLRSLVGG